MTYNEDLAMSPLGVIPKEFFAELLKKTNYGYRGTLPVSILDFTVIPDSDQDAHKYREMVSAKRSNGGQVTCLKNMIEAEIFKAYRAQYSDLREACMAYLKNSDPLLRGTVVDRIRTDNMMAGESGATESQLKRMKREQKFNSL